MLSNAPQVFVFDELTETADVLRAVLEPRGLGVCQVRPASGVSRSAAPPEHAAVLIVDAETAALAPAGAPCWANVPQIVIGSMRLPDCAPDASANVRLEKPFHYAELIRAVEAAIGSSGAAAQTGSE
jgi:hypothetical protein